MRIEFPVQDIPPKKGPTSPWSKESEARRIISLRKAAFQKMKEKGLDQCFTTPVKLEVTVFASRVQLGLHSGYYIGDLDTFVAGICEGLQAADNNVKVTHELIQELEQTEISHTRKLLLDNDALVMSIVAKKITIDEREQAHYEVAVESVSFG